jgi:dTDP-4-dehydrorhamnose 3,5-epimerase-like enzyme
VDVEFGRGRSGVIRLPVVPDARGNLTFIEGQKHIPFEIRRVYYLYDVPSGASRGGHAHRELQQLLIALSGSFDVLVDNGKTKERFSLNRSHVGLYIGPFLWREIDNFSSNAICLVLASKPYDENDYFRTYDGFIQALEL